jgi:hypothetical protein
LFVGALYEQLELERRKRLYAWPEKVGIDEHLFKHDFRLNQRRFVTMVVDHKNKRLLEVVEGKDGASLATFPVARTCASSRSTCPTATGASHGASSRTRSSLPSKFHVLRLITPAIHRRIRALGLGRDALPFYRQSDSPPAGGEVTKPAGETAPRHGADDRADGEGGPRHGGGRRARQSAER